MRNHIVMLIASLFACQISMAQLNSEQHSLAAQDLSDGVSVFSTEGEWAGVILQCKKTYNLTVVSSSADKSIVDMRGQKIVESLLKKSTSAIFIKEDADDSNKYYHYMFRVGKKYDERFIVVYAEGLASTSIDLAGLSPKSLRRYRLYDSQSINDGSNFQKHSLTGQDYFNECNYMAAKQEYTLAKYCIEATESDKEAMQDEINKCDSLILWTKVGNKLAEEGHYSRAADMFRRALMHNNSDKYLFNRYYEFSRKQVNTCSIYFAEAERAYKAKEYEAANKLYQTVMDNGCSQEAVATIRSRECSTLLRRQQNRERYLGLEFGTDKFPTYGLTSASYRKKVAYYFSLRVNNSALELARQNFNLNDYAVVDVNLIGLTIPVVKPIGDIFQGVWINAGIGGSGFNKFVLRSDAKDKYFDGMETVTQDDIQSVINEHEDEDLKSPDLLKLKLGYAITPEIGLTVKVWRFAVRGTYQMRMIQTSEFKNIDQIKDSQFSLGIGYCF